jgi:glycosyltransferase involved in cell wall biosynthesis
MKLLHVIGSMNPQTGGPCQMIRNFAPEFVGQGNTLEVISLDEPGSAYLSGDSFRIHALGQGRGSWNYHPALVPWLNEHLTGYDAVILNGLWQFQGYALWQASKNPKVPPYYIFPHGMLDPWFQKISVRPLKTLRNWVFWKTIQHRIVHQSAGLLFTCEEERRLARLPFRPYHPVKEAVVGLGVPEPPEFQPQMTAAFVGKCPATAGGKYFLFLGRIHPKKGVDLLIKAFSALCRANTSHVAIPKLVIAGPDLESSYGQAMLKLASETCPANSVLWPGMLVGDAKWGALYGAEAFVLTSHQENFGIAVVEALACGKPVLISSQINIWREIEQDRAGLVRDDTLQGAEELFRQWKSLSQADKATIKAAAKSCYENRFGVAPATRRLLAAIQEPAGDTQPGSGQRRRNQNSRRQK